VPRFGAGSLESESGGPIAEIRDTDCFPRRMDGESIRVDRKRTDTDGKKTNLDAEEIDTDLKAGLTDQKKIGADQKFRIFLFPKRNAPSPFTSRLSRCRLTFTKPPIPPNRSVPSRLSKASTTSRFAATRKLAKERGV